MRKQVTNTRSERQLKFAEAGILFVLVLGLVLFVGVKVASRDSGQELALADSQESVVEVATTEGILDPVIEDAIAALEIETPAEDSGADLRMLLDLIVFLNRKSIGLQNDRIRNTDLSYIV